MGPRWCYLSIMRRQPGLSLPIGRTQQFHNDCSVSRAKYYHAFLWCVIFGKAFHVAVLYTAFPVTRRRVAQSSCITFIGAFDFCTMFSFCFFCLSFSSFWSCKVFSSQMLAAIASAGDCTCELTVLCQ